MRDKAFERLRARRNQRFSDYGRDFEQEMCKFLEKLKEAGDITDFLYHEPHSESDRAGKDFTVAKLVNEVRQEHSFGVTISLQRWPISKACHPNVPQFCFPIGTKPETIKKRILELFLQTSTETKEEVRG